MSQRFEILWGTLLLVALGFVLYEVTADRGNDDNLVERSRRSLWNGLSLISLETSDSGSTELRVEANGSILHSWRDKQCLETHRTTDPLANPPETTVRLHLDDGRVYVLQHREGAWSYQGKSPVVR